MNKFNFLPIDRLRKWIPIFILILGLGGCGDRLREDAIFIVNVRTRNPMGAVSVVRKKSNVSIRAYFYVESGGDKFTNPLLRDLVTDNEGKAVLTYTANEICFRGSVSKCHLVGGEVTVLVAGDWEAAVIAEAKLEKLQYNPGGTGGTAELNIELPN